MFLVHWGDCKCYQPCHARFNFICVNVCHCVCTVLLLNKYTVSQKNCATFIFTVTLANVGRFLKFFQCRNQKEMDNKNEKFPTVA